MTDLESGFRLADLLDLLRRRSAFVVGAAVLGLIAGFMVFAGSPPNYSATARVQVRPLATGAGTVTSPDSSTVDIGTERDLVRSDVVADTVRAELDRPDATNRGLFGTLTVKTNKDSLVLEMTVQSSSASEARDLANAIADGYLQQRRQEAVAATDRLEAQLTDARVQVGEAVAAVDAAGSASEQVSAERVLRGAQDQERAIEDRLNAYGDPETAGGDVSKRATLPDSVLSKMALAKGVGVFGLFIIGGLGVALLFDRRDSLGGGRRKVAQLAPQANLRVMPTASGRKVGPAEADAAIDRLAVELVNAGGTGRASSVLLVGTRGEPPVALAEELASSLTFAGIPALFVLAGSAERDVRHAHVVTSFSDLITGPSVAGPASLPEVAGTATGTAAPTVTWLRPRGSAEASGLLRRAVVEALVARAGREGFEAVVFVAATPTRNAAAAALGQWVAKTAVIVENDDGPAVEAAVSALVEADVAITEVVWT
ncbi:MAG: Wzz/FepE/Etk N-terminal domain-containing protein [Aquihabitans sp.]